MNWVLLFSVACTPQLERLLSGGGDDTGDVVDRDQDGWRASLDCDDEDPSIHPEAEEVCDGLDQDCDDLVDEGLDGTWYRDGDGDGWGSGEPLTDCRDATGTVLIDGDCDDDDEAVHPEAQEVCNGVDDDCDDETDESAADATTWYADSDLDGFGDPETSVSSCDAPPDWTDDASDCDDDDDQVHPDAEETWYDGVDADCDGGDDYDADGDGYDLSLDCDDGSALLSPGGEEICGDGIDNDCDGSAPACSLTGDFDLALSPASFHGQAAGDAAGTAVTGTGDVDGDGRDDLAVGAPGDDQAASDAGSVHLFLAPFAGAVSLAEADLTWTGPAEEAAAGTRLAAPGDLDGDGQAELIVAAPGADTVYVVSWSGAATPLALGSAASHVLEGTTGSSAGEALGGAGDRDGDGVADLLVGAPYLEDQGKPLGGLHLVAGPLAAVVDLAGDGVRTLVGESSYDLAGVAVAWVGDLDGDGLDEVLVGAPRDDHDDTDSGSAYLLLGDSGPVDLADADASIRGHGATEYLGEAVAGAGDVDGDGHADFLVGAPGADVNASNDGAAYLFTSLPSGSVSASSADAVLHGEDASDRAGGALAGAGDVDGFGHDDLLIGADRQGSAAAYGGAAYVVSGPVSGTFDLGGAEARLRGAGSYDYAGAAVAGAGDTDWDGRGDVVVGAIGEDSGGSGAGMAYLVLGCGI